MALSKLMYGVVWCAKYNLEKSSNYSGNQHKVFIFHHIECTCMAWHYCIYQFSFATAAPFYKSFDFSNPDSILPTNRGWIWFILLFNALKCPVRVQSFIYYTFQHFCSAFNQTHNYSFIVTRICECFNFLETRHVTLCRTVGWTFLIKALGSANSGAETINDN
jgi:hypothetical protein